MHAVTSLLCSCAAKYLSCRLWCTAYNYLFNYTQNVCWGLSPVLESQPQEGRAYLVHCHIHRVQPCLWHTGAPQHQHRNPALAMDPKAPPCLLPQWLPEFPASQALLASVASVAQAELADQQAYPQKLIVKPPLP